MNKMSNDYPPILPDIEEQLKEYLICPDKLPIHRYERNQEFWPRKPDISSLFYHEGSPLATTLKVHRDPNSGEIIEFKEVPLAAAGATPRNSMSYNRAPAPPNDAVRGNPANIPFWPGGFPDPVLDLPKNVDVDNEELLTVPPGFTRGLEFESERISFANIKGPSKINLPDLIQQEEDLLGLWKTPEITKSETEASTKTFEELPEEVLIPKEIPVLKITENESMPAKLLGSEYAVLLDCTREIPDFYDQIPEMAHQYPFELDIFQKQAILQLEKHNHVFVAAHTSAGKTVVAEYAIALSQKNMTRSIYTSPIKALSNQKYRDFKNTFKDVGLITGDFQINQTASCLIMTTEILEKMLCCGSDVTRDLEFVIFDEVHYINDKERGHVWEQVLIFLPAHVCIILLSATVSNTIQFADWIGRTHQKKVYVVSTSQRPVPLEHYLYTGTGGSTKDNRFLILDSKGWKLEGYAQAKMSINPKKPVLKQEKSLWYALIDHLNQKKLLPVVIFTFSRVKCDVNAENLKSLDLTTGKEKSAIYRFFEECIKSLKEPDREIPQILRMKDILQRGIGVHHSGILPIIKEMVEMLFQNGLIKILFATETFAMGVNMPARTVIFDSITKHDGRESRTLLPAEYIQMAGRAGRRGKDKKGTVIILTKCEMHDSQKLQEMMLGKPSQLISQFRLTYKKVLWLLRLENLNVEDVMSKSFQEAENQKNMGDKKEDLAKIETTLKQDFNAELSEHLKPLISFYEKAKQYLDRRDSIFVQVISSPKVLKELSPGRLVVITHANHINKLAFVLKTIVRSNNVSFKVLVITDNSENKIEQTNQKDLWHKMVGLSKDEIYVPITNPSHAVLTIFPKDIFEICHTKIKIDAEKVLSDWDKRQQPRFATDPPGPTCATAVEELMKITMGVQSESKVDIKVRYLDLIADLKVNDQCYYDEINSLNNLRDNVYEHLDAVRIPNFEEQFESVFKRKHLEDSRDDLKFYLSNKSLALYPDYQSRIKLLRELKYIDEQNRVELKGKVACEMGMNELMVTELVLRNVLTKLQPAEVAALLSCLVFQAKTKVCESDFKLTPDLQNAMEEIESIFMEIKSLESEFRICCDIEEKLNFKLVEVVYEWASAKPFSEIMALTDVQEGIIVRCIQQLNETINDVKNAARLIGDPQLQNKMEEASTAVKRDIVFAASLYTQREANI